MQRRAIRLVLLALLVAAAAGAGVLTWTTERRIDAQYGIERDLDYRIDRLARRVIAFGAAQQASLAPGHSQAEALHQSAALLRQIRDDLAALDSRLQTASAAETMRTLGGALETAEALDSRIREHIQAGQELMAADLVFTEGRQPLEAMSAALRGLDQAERDAANDRRRALQLEAAAYLLGAAGLWLLGSLALVPIPAGRAAGDPIRIAPEPEAATPPSAAGSHAAPASLTEAAEVCTGLARVTAASDLPPLLSRAAKTLDASGLIVWLGAGEELFAVMAHGYDARVLSRLGPIRRDARNATAAAWRSATLHTVAGDARTRGAIVAPLFGGSGCIGALAAEVRQGRELDETTRALMTMFAAQLATVVSAWPAPSAAGESSASADGQPPGNAGTGAQQAATA